MEIKIITRDKITIAAVSGNLDGNTVIQAQEAIMPLITPNCLLVMDMQQCHYISSAGLRLLLMMGKLFSNNGGRGVLACLSEEIKDVMEMTGFDHIFKNHETVSVAIEAVQKEIAC
jgi:anti-anti-sigma factor